MASLGFTNDWVQLPEDGSGKKTGYYRWDTGGGNFLYLGAGVITGPDGVLADVNSSGALKVNQDDIQATYAITGTGTQTAIDLAGMSTAALRITGTHSNTIKVQVSQDGSNWSDLNAAMLDGPTGSANITSNGEYFFYGLSRYRSIRVNCTSYTSGTMNVALTLQPHSFAIGAICDDGSAGGSGATGQALPFRMDSYGVLLTTNGGSIGGSEADSLSTVYFGGGVRKTEDENIALVVSQRAFNGSTYDRVRTIGVGDGAAHTGILAAGLMAYNGTMYDRVRSSNGAIHISGDEPAGGGDSGNPVKVGGVYNSVDLAYDDGDRGDLQIDSTGRLKVLQPRRSVSVSITTTTPDVADLNVEGMGYATVQVLGTWTGTLTFQATVDDGANWFSVRAYNNSINASGNNGTTTVIANGQWIIPVRGYQQIRVDGPTSTGTANVVISAGAGSPPHFMGQTYSGFQTVATVDKVPGSDAVSNSQLSQLLYDTGGVYSSPLPLMTALFGFNGTSWDRIRTANTGRLQVDVITGSSQYAEDGGLGATPTGTVAMARRDDALATLTPVEDDAISLRVNARGALWTMNESDAATGAAVPSRASYMGASDGTNLIGVKTTDAFVTAAASPSVGILASLAPDRRFTSVNLGTVVGNTQSWDVNGADCAIVHIGTTTTGTFLFEVSADGTNYVSAEVRDVVLDTWQSGVNLTPTANKVYRVITNGWRSMRVRTITTLGGTVACTTTLAQHSTVLNAIDSGPAPHAIGYSITGKTAEYTTTQTGVALWTPASGKKLVITSYQIQVGGTTAGTVQLWFGASADTAYTRGTDLAIFDGQFAPSSTLKPGVVQTGCWPASAVDHILRVTDSAAINPLTVTVWGYEV